MLGVGFEGFEGWDGGGVELRLSWEGKKRAKGR